MSNKRKYPREIRDPSKFEDFFEDYVFDPTFGLVLRFLFNLTNNDSKLPLFDSKDEKRRLRSEIIKSRQGARVNFDKQVEKEQQEQIAKTAKANPIVPRPDHVDLLDVVKSGCELYALFKLKGGRIPICEENPKYTTNEIEELNYGFSGCDIPPFSKYEYEIEQDLKALRQWVRAGYSHRFPNAQLPPDFYKTIHKHVERMKNALWDEPSFLEVAHDFETNENQGLPFFYQETFLSYRLKEEILNLDL